METILETDGLKKTFDSVTAVNGVDLTVSRGEICGLIGPNGAGKTTFMNLITGAQPATEGTIYFEGQDVTDRPPHKRAQDGIVKKYQITNIYDEKTVEENVELAVRSRRPGLIETLRGRGTEAVQLEVPELLAAATLEEKRGVLAETLSHGEKQWLEIVMALGADPELLLLDEPTSGMGPEETTETIELLREIRSRNPELSILVIEHDVEFIKELADRIVVLHRGEVIASGTSDVIEQDEKVQEVYL